MVQINVEVKSKPGEKPRLNIVDILKPAEEMVELQDTLQPPSPVPPPPRPQPVAAPVRVPTTKKVVIPFPEESENVTRWIVDQTYRSEQQRLKIPLGKMRYPFVLLFYARNSSNTVTYLDIFRSGIVVDGAREALDSMGGQRVFTPRRQHSQL